MWRLTSRTLPTRAHTPDFGIPTPCDARDAQMAPDPSAGSATAPSHQSLTRTYDGE